MMSRRRILKTLGGGAALALSGCVGTRWWEDEDGTSSEPSGQSKTNTTDANEQDNDTGDNSNESGQEDATDDSGESKNTGNNEESQQEPSEEETEINRDQYDQQKVSDTKDRSVDDIEIDADSQIANDGSATVTGTVTNVSETPIDVVDLEVVFYDADDEYLSAQLVTITDLDAGKGEQFEAGIAPDGTRGQPKRVEINPDVYDRAD